MQEKQNIKEYTPAAKAALSNIREVLFAASQSPRNRTSLAAEPVRDLWPKTRGEARALLLTQAQSDALAEMQRMCLEIAGLQNRMNIIAVTYELNLPRVFLPEVTERLMDIDGRVMLSKWIARRLGVQPITYKGKHVSPPLVMAPRANTQNKQPRIRQTAKVA